MKEQDRTPSPTGATEHPGRLPKWIKIRPRVTDGYLRVHSILKKHGLHSVCQEAGCPNIRECYGRGTATFIILGDRCTRNCRFCGVRHGRPEGLDTDEPRRLAEVVAELKLKQVVITSVTRDDLPDGGASIFAAVMEELRRRDGEVKVEFLIPDLMGDQQALRTILASGVDVLNHNVETVGRLYAHVRPGASLARSLDVLRYASEYKPRPVVKTGFMVGLGETHDEVMELFTQVRAAGVDLITIGQYLRPSVEHLPVARYYTPEEFEELARVGLKMGFAHVESGPLVRSSYKAFDQARDLLENR